jgi:hypothetical protein
MRQRFVRRIGLALAAGLAAAGGAQDPAARPGHALFPVGPLGHWKADDGDAPQAAADATGNGRTGTYSPGSGTSKEVPAVKFANASSFNLDGKTGLITVPDAPEFRLAGDFTVAFWKRKTAPVGDWVRLVGKGNGAQRNFGIWEFPGEGGQVKFQIYNAGGGSVLEVDSPGGTPMNAWTHVACVVSSGAAILYLNGAPVAGGLRNGDPGTSADPLTFGHAGFHSFFPGQLDDIRIHDRALSTSEVVYLAEGRGPPEAPASLTATAKGPGQVELKWGASPTPPPAGTATYYLVKRSAGAGWATVATFLRYTSYTDEKAEAGKTFSYLVTAMNTAGEGAPSNEAKVAVPSK